MSVGGVNQLIINYAKRFGRDRQFSFLGERGDIYLELAAEDILSKSRKYAGALQKLGVKQGDRVCIVVPEQDHFVQVFYACMLSGFIAVPLAAPRDISSLNEYLAFIAKVYEITTPAAFIATPKLKPFLKSVPLINQEIILTQDEISNYNADFKEPLEIGSIDTALLQFTSGSTSTPKGVMVSHGNLIANAQAIVKSINLTSDDKFCSWLPFYHDMGLIGFLIAPLIGGVSGYYFSPLIFLKRPIFWLKTISKYRCTISFAPNFAFGLCNRRINEEQLTELNLESWRYAGCGAEPINLKTIREFIEKFAKVGFNINTFKPCYGLAEHTLAVTLTSAETKFRYETVSRSKLALKNEVHFTSRDDLMEVVSCGIPLADHRVEILDENGDLCREHTIGEVTAFGPSVAQGYYGNPQATAEVFQSGRLYTGDLGYFSQGELFVCGRKKDLIIIAGRNYYPADIEGVVWDLEGIRKGNVIAISVNDEEGEKLVILAECRKGNSKDILIKLPDKIRTVVADYFGVSCEVVLLPEGSLPKTSSGKLQRVKSKELYARGKLLSRSWLPRSIKNLLTILSYKR